MKDEPSRILALELKGVKDREKKGGFPSCIARIIKLICQQMRTAFKFTNMYKLSCLFVLLVTLLPAILLGQKKQTKHVEPLKLTELKKVLNNAFSKLVTSNANPGEIANYASLDPVNAAFNVKGSIPIKYGKTAVQAPARFEDNLGADVTNISYLSFSLSGNLIDKSYAKLLSNSSFNAGIDFQAQYNFRIRQFKYAFSNDEWSPIALKRDLLISNYQKAYATLEKTYTDTFANYNLKLLGWQRHSDSIKLDALKHKMDALGTLIGNLKDTASTKPGLIDSLQTMVKVATTYQTTIDAATISIDSITLTKKNDLFFLQMNQETLLNNKLQQDYDSTMIKATLRRLKLGWFTLLAGASKKAYTTFDPALSFGSQIAQHNLNAFNFGVAYNYIIQDKIKAHTLFLNLSFSRLSDNNLSGLSTTEIDQSKKIVNPGGDTSRTFSTKYNVYTDPVTDFLAWNFSANFYYLYGKTPSGFHVFPSINFQNNNLTLTNVSVGYIISFQNATKDQPVVNTELYFRFKDVFNEQKMTKGFWNRNELGLSFTIPFNIFN